MLKHRPIPEMSQSDINRFLSKIDIKSEDQCWNWKKGTSTFGHGQFWLKDKGCRAHRISYMIKYGSIPKDKLVLHKCDNPRCVNPNHLFLGNQDDNMKDMVSKKRSLIGDRNPTRTNPECLARGSKNGFAKLTESKVLEIRRLYHNPYSQRQLAKLFGVTQPCIKIIVKRQGWKHI
jgi:hypothetical protein